MNRTLAFLFSGFLGAVLGAGQASAQLVLPGAAPATQKGAAAAAAKPKRSGAAGTSAKPIPSPLPTVSTLAGHALLLNGKAGLLQISGDDNSAQIEKLRFSGEGVSDPSQQCVVDIVGEKPIDASSAGRPDGLERFEADVPACPFAFDVLDGAVLVPSQIAACVFKAADCQTSPGGLWGPDGASLVGEADKIVKERAAAEKEMGKLVHVIEDRARDNEDAANLVRDQTAFAGQRADACRDYAKESVHGYCAMRLTEARVALLQTRLAALGPAHATKADADKGKRSKSKRAEKQPSAE